MALPAGLPAPLRRHLEALSGPAPVESLGFSGRGRIRQPVLGPLGLWLSLTWEAELLPGRAFAWRARACLLGLPLLRASDEFRRDRGRLAIGRRVFNGDAIDRAEYAVLWSWTVLLALPSVLGRPGVLFEPVDGATARLLFPFRAETWEALLRFDAGSGLLTRLETHRVDARSAYPRRWSVEVEGYGVFGGRRLPAAVVSRWEEEPAVRLTLERAVA